jgi:hypothetical protein
MRLKEQSVMKLLMLIKLNESTKINRLTRNFHLVLETIHLPTPSFWFNSNGFYLICVAIVINVKELDGSRRFCFQMSASDYRDNTQITP